MYVVNRKRISLILICLLLGIFAYSYESTKMNFKQEIQQTASTPVSGKVIVVDAGHRSSRWEGLLIEVLVSKAINTNISIKTI